MSDEIQAIDDPYDAFVERLENSREAVFAVAMWLHRKGRTVTIPRTRVAPRYAKSEGYVDDGDIIAEDENGNVSVIEVKGSQRFNFTDAESWPYPVVVISNASTVDRNRGKIAAYIVVSSDRKNMAIINTKDIDTWEKKDLWAHNTKKFESFYTCKPNSCTFRSLEIK